MPVWLLNIQKKKDGTIVSLFCSTWQGTAMPPERHSTSITDLKVSNYIFNSFLLCR